MRQVFISYARDDRSRVEALAERLRRLVDGVWFDSQLHGGEDWWAGILDRIRGCDIFLAVVSAASLSSEACRIEREYAASVRRTIVPVALGAVPPALPGDVATLQIVDFSTPGEQALSDLARALLAAPDPEPLPDPLPPDPKAPLSYLTDLVDLVDSRRELTKSEQMEILLSLERGLESADHDERAGARQVLERMKNRDDLAASVEKTIGLLSREQLPRVAAPRPDESRREHRPTPPPPRTPPVTAAPVESRPARPPVSRPPGPTGPPVSAGQEPEEQTPRPAVLIGAAVALVVLATVIAWAVVGRGGGDDTAAVTQPQPEITEPTEDPTSDPTDNAEEPERGDGTSAYWRACRSIPVDAFPGAVEPFATATDYPDDRTMVWMCLLGKHDVIGREHALNFTGNYGGAIPERVEQEKHNRGYPGELVDARLDREFWDCLAYGTCPSDDSAPGPSPSPLPPPSPTPTPMPPPTPDETPTPTAGEIL